MEIGLEAFWEQQAPDASQCRACKENIYSNMYVFVFQSLNDRAEIAKYCERCFDSFEIDEWRTG